MSEKPALFLLPANFSVESRPLSFEYNPYPSSAVTTHPISSKSNFQNHQEDDEIQEYVPVKTEPVSQHPEPVSHHYSSNTSSSHGSYAPTAMTHEGIVAEAGQEYNEDYAEYESYEDGVEDSQYDGSMLNPSTMGGSDNNKGN